MLVISLSLRRTAPILTSDPNTEAFSNQTGHHTQCLLLLNTSSHLYWTDSTHLYWTDSTQSEDKDTPTPNLCFSFSLSLLSRPALSCSSSRSFFSFMSCSPLSQISSPLSEISSALSPMPPSPLLSNLLFLNIFSARTIRGVGIG